MSVESQNHHYSLRIVGPNDQPYEGLGLGEISFGSPTDGFEALEDNNYISRSPRVPLQEVIETDNDIIL